MTLVRHYTVSNSFGDSILIDEREARELLALLLADLGESAPATIAPTIIEEYQEDDLEGQTVEPAQTHQPEVSEAPSPQIPKKTHKRSETFEQYCARRARELDGHPDTIGSIQQVSYRKPWGKKTFAEIRKAIADAGLDFDAMRAAFKARRDGQTTEPRAPQRSRGGEPEKAPSATDAELGIEGTIGQRAAKVLELAADGVPYELIALQTGFKTEKVIQFCAENQSRVRRIASFSDPEMRTAYIQGVALGFNKKARGEQRQADQLGAA